MDPAYGSAPVPIRTLVLRMAARLERLGCFSWKPFWGLGWCGGVGVALVPWAAAGCWGLPPALPLGFLWVVCGVVVCVAFAGLLACLP